MDDLIKRQDAITAYCEHECGKGMIRGECGCDDCGTIFDDIPSAEPERKKGEWVVYKAPDQHHCGLVECPFCGEDMVAEADEYNYCPNCGAEMRGKQP